MGKLRRKETIGGADLLERVTIQTRSITILRMIHSNGVLGNKEDLKKVRDINEDKRRDVETKGGWFQDLLIKMIIGPFLLIREMLMIRNESLTIVHFINILR